MSKKFFALFFLTFANALLLIHSIIPHHHHEMHDGMAGAAQQQVFCEDHFDSHDHHDGMLSDILAEFPHASHYLSAQSPANNFKGAELTLLTAIVPECAFILHDYVTNEIALNIVPDINYSFSTVHQYGLRAPPAL